MGLQAPLRVEKRNSQMIPHAINRLATPERKPTPTLDSPHTTGASPPASATLNAQPTSTSRLQRRAQNHATRLATPKTPNASCATLCTRCPVVVVLGN